MIPSDPKQTPFVFYPRGIEQNRVKQNLNWTPQVSRTEEAAFQSAGQGPHFEQSWRRLVCLKAIASLRTDSTEANVSLFFGTQSMRMHPVCNTTLRKYDFSGRTHRFL